MTVLAVAPQTMLSGARPDPSHLLWDLVPSYREKVSEATTQIVVEATKRLPAGPARVESQSRLGNPIDQIVQVATESEVDVVALGSRGHSTFASLVLGSVSFGVLAHAPCSVLVAKPAERPPRQLLFATDGSAFSQRAEDLVAVLAKPADARLTVLSVAEPFGALAGTAATFAPAVLEEVGRRHLEEAHERAAAAARRLSAAGWQTSDVVLENSAAAGILQLEREIGADLIVIGSHGRTGATAYVLGSVAQTVAHHSRASVLMVKERSPFPPQA